MVRQHQKVTVWHQGSLTCGTTLFHNKSCLFVVYGAFTQCIQIVLFGITSIKAFGQFAIRSFNHVGLHHSRQLQVDQPAGCQEG